MILFIYYARWQHSIKIGCGKGLQSYSMDIYICISYTVFLEFYKILFFVSFYQILMKPGMNDMKARSYKVTEQILNICINRTN